MDSANYGGAVKYDQNETTIIKLDKKLENIETIIAEQIIKDREIKLNLYYKKVNNDEYIKTESYNVPLTGYEDLKLMDLLDMSRFFPAKHLHIESMPDYLLGYTAIGSPNIFRNSRLIPGSERAYEVDVHETIHTNDEFETRMLTSWILDKDINKYLFNKGVVLNKKIN
ncbi:hypothetical protein HOC35_05890 [Candidatus Woesearchaeota archaeon]|jgi:hypothetical protein|nr:hypothetical protein [Candidatus Woesearchaeota archaeon]